MPRRSGRESKPPTPIQIPHSNAPGKRKATVPSPNKSPSKRVIMHPLGPNGCPACAGRHRPHTCGRGKAYLQQLQEAAAAAAAIQYDSDDDDEYYNDYDDDYVDFESDDGRFQGCAHQIFKYVGGKSVVHV